VSAIRSTPVGRSILCRSERQLVDLAGADAHRAVDPGYEDFSVADLSGLGRGADGLDGFLDAVVPRKELKPYVSQALSFFLD